MSSSLTLHLIFKTFIHILIYLMCSCVFVCIVCMHAHMHAHTYACTHVAQCTSADKCMWGSEDNLRVVSSLPPPHGSGGWNLGHPPGWVASLLRQKLADSGRLAGQQVPGILLCHQPHPSTGKTGKHCHAGFLHDAEDATSGPYAVQQASTSHQALSLAITE